MITLSLPKGDRLTMYILSLSKEPAQAMHTVTPASSKTRVLRLSRRVSS